MKKISHGCTLDCADCCKFNVYVKNDDIIKIEGDKEHPYTKGFICKKGLAHLKRLNHSKRIYKPLIKINDKWKEIEFDEAINIMVKKLSYYKSKFGSKSILYCFVINGQIPEWPKGTDCKSAATCFDGSNPSLPIKKPQVV